MNKETLLELTTEIVSSYVEDRENLSIDELPKLIDTVYGSLNQLAEGRATLSLDRPEPAVPVKKSITDDYLICLEDGKQLKMLKRHLRTHYSLTPEEYRARWGLPSDYPMTAPSYAKKRSKLAKNIGLGSKTSRKKSA